jgi:hypothetical protein
VSPTNVSTDLLQSQFLAVLPRLQAHARGAFRFLRCPHRRDDALAEVAALVWLGFVRLAQRGRDPVALVGPLLRFAIRQVRCGRRLCGQEPSQDVLSWHAWRCQGFSTSSLPEQSTLNSNPLEEALHDNRRTPVPEQVVFRLDWPAWLDTLTSRDRALLHELALSHTTLDVARRFQLCPSRISQLRREFHAGWERFGDNRTERRSSHS